MGLAQGVDQPTWADRRAAGRALRKKVPRSALGRWRAQADRPDPVDMVELSHLGRLERLIPVRVGRMCASPYAFLRGNAAIMAEDFSNLPETGVTAVICGDAHLGNFGFYASPERDLVFDLNDFDEAHPGAWEWDLRRLTASAWVAGRQNGFAEDTCADAVAWCVRAYRRQVRRLSRLPLLEQSFERLDIDRMRAETSDRALPKLTAARGGIRRIVDQPPLVTNLPPDEAERLVAGLDDYLGTLPRHWRRVLSSYQVADVAMKVVGVGSVGLRAYIALLFGNGPGDPLFLQAKQARRSCVARYVHGEAPRHAHQGQRVVEYQQALQTVSDPVLGGYLGKADAAERALCRFAAAYADQTERDHQALLQAVKRGRLPAEFGV